MATRKETGVRKGDHRERKKRREPLPNPSDPLDCVNYMAVPLFMHSRSVLYLYLRLIDSVRFRTKTDYHTNQKVVFDFSIK